MFWLRSRLRLPVLGLLLLSFFATSCASTPEEQQQVGGALAGAAVGALTGVLTGHGAKGALIGAAAGAAIGWGATKLYQVHTAQVRSAQEDKQIDGLTTAGDSPVVKIRSVSSAPEKVKRGDKVTITTDYSLALPKGTKEATVAESWVLKKDGKELTQLPAQQGTRIAGGYQAEGAITIPKDVASGTYVVEHKVQAGTSYDVAQSVFYVG